MGAILPSQALILNLSFPGDGVVGYSAILSRFTISVSQRAARYSGICPGWFHFKLSKSRYSEELGAI
jgi:hypothetical protein